MPLLIAGSPGEDPELGAQASLREGRLVSALTLVQTVRVIAAL